MNAPADKPNAARLGWKVEQAETPFKSEVLEIRQDRIAANGSETQYAYIRRAPAVIVVPITADGKLVIVRQYRYPIAISGASRVPAGGTHDTEGESLDQVARDELREEIGGTTDKLTAVTSFYTSPSLVTEQCHVFLAENVQLAHKPDTETTEEIRIKTQPVPEVLRLVRAGEMRNAPCALAVLLCEPLLKDRGYLD